jgi:hypothetical protein
MYVIFLILEMKLTVIFFLVLLHVWVDVKVFHQYLKVKENKMIKKVIKNEISYKEIGINDVDISSEQSNLFVKTKNLGVTSSHILCKISYPFDKGITYNLIRLCNGNRWTDCSYTSFKELLETIPNKEVFIYETKEDLINLIKEHGI